jgi:hypothetical protein
MLPGYLGIERIEPLLRTDLLTSSGKVLIKFGD